ncbi:bifunctional 2-polyprenyl-6-hydroxyphenol methylase/3-demethylubiquinol 3-O-methyltransferase UbiG [Calothrix sp. PCC 7507]|uniref:class I SAM-dependent methyltransferase n=1 Tax=Calothrix sp. PCC 7507 TaxID=99598 RepID=UPI00029EDCC3|nr:class I SAM-dependent methyltransferase [Calothrix sp. PCC 7507]AFY32500.1 Methyltransferase type 12 [Calothrix sp. PCC 7507]
MRKIESTTHSNVMIIKVIRKCVQLFKYWDIEGYQAEKYWSDRHSQYQFNLQGVGNAALTHEDNEQMYLKAKEVFLSVCHEMKIDFTKIRMLDIGCGTGFYAKIFRENGGKNYLGVDITDVLFDQLEKDLSGFKFHKLDVSRETLNHRFDLIIMIDVTQHITNNEKFSFAMQNIRSSLSENGIFIVTSWLNENARQRFYEVSRSLQAYQAEFPDCTFSQPIPFRDKFIFAIQNKK